MYAHKCVRLVKLVFLLETFQYAASIQLSLMMSFITPLAHHAEGAVT